MDDLTKTFNRVREKMSGSTQVTYVEDIPGIPDHKLGSTGDGHPVFFIESNDSVNSMVDTHLDQIQIEFNKNCQITSNDQVKNGVFIIVSLKNDSQDVIKYFLNSVHFLLKQIENFPSFRSFVDELKKLVLLFKSQGKRAKKEPQGLWAELFFISQSSDPQYLLKCWRLSDSDRYDFNDGIDKLEVKSTSKRNRIHRFSHSQLSELSDSMVAIGSIIVSESGDGSTINDLMREIEERVDNPELNLKLKMNILDIMGSEFDRVFNTFYDIGLAKSSKELFDIKNISKINEEHIPNNITGLKFDCDLSGVNPLRFEDVPESNLLKLIFHEEA
jgi:hypothetical protein